MSSNHENEGVVPPTFCVNHPSFRNNIKLPTTNGIHKLSSAIRILMIGKYLPDIASVIAVIIPIQSLAMNDDSDILLLSLLLAADVD